MVRNYNKVRFFLFCNSYSGKKIATCLKGNYKGRNLTKVIKRFSVVLGFKHTQTGNYILIDIKPKSPYRRFPYSLKTYLEIEKELTLLTEEKLDEYSTAKEDYQRRLLSPAIERAAGNSLINVKNDQKFNKKLKEKIKRYTNIYYKVAYKYKLPTIRIVSFLLRLIG